MTPVGRTGTHTGLSLLDGGPLPDPGVTGLTEILRRAADNDPGQSLRFIGPDGSETRSSYPELYEHAARVLAGLLRTGTRPGDRVVLRTREEPNLLAAFWGCVIGGLIPVPVSAALPDRAVAQAAQTVDAQRVLTGHQIVEFRNGPTGGDVVTGGWDDLAVLMLTAGSSGTAKAVRLTHGNIIGRSAATALANDLTADLTTFNWMPLDHVSGLVMFHLRDVFLACRQIHARKDWVLADPLRWLDAVDAARADVTWGTNSSFDLLNDRLEADGTRNWDLSCLRYVMNGGQAVRTGTIRRFAANTARFGLPRTAMRPGWGMSETASGIVDHRIDLDDLNRRELGHSDLDRSGLDRSAGADRLVPVGTPHPGVRVRVVDAEDRLLPPGMPGHLQVAGPPVTAGYWGDDERTRTARTADGWFRSGDMAFVADGLLTVTGSADDFILIDGRGHHGHEIATVIEQLPFVQPGSAVAVEVPQRGTDAPELVLFVQLRPEATASEDEAVRRIGEAVAARFDLTMHQVVLCANDIPRTGTGKPQRARLREWFLEQEDRTRWT